MVQQLLPSCWRGPLRAFALSPAQNSQTTSWPSSAKGTSPALTLSSNNSSFLTMTKIFSSSLSSSVCCSASLPLAASTHDSKAVEWRERGGRGMGGKGRVPRAVVEGQEDCARESYYHSLSVDGESALLETPREGGEGGHSGQHDAAAEISLQSSRQPRGITQNISDLMAGLRFLPRVLSIAVTLFVLFHPFSSIAHVSTTASFPASSPAVSAFSLSFHWSEILTSGWTGLVAGGLHTLTGADHLAALAPLTIGRTRMESAAIGGLWGLGHDAGQVLFGILFLLLKERLHLEVVRVWGARVVGLTMLAIGALGIQEAHAMEAEEKAGEGGGVSGGVGEEGAAWERVKITEGGEAVVVEKRAATFGIATFVMGIVHGLQPDALLVVLPALAMPSRLAGAAFLIMFLLGTVVAMGSYAAFIGSCSSALKERVPGLTRRLSWGAGALAVLFGLGIISSEFLGFTLF